MELHNPANTFLMHRGGRLFSLWEGGHPVEVDAETLETISVGVRVADARRGAPVSTDVGALDSLLGLGGEAVGSHPVVDVASGRTVLLLSTVTPSRVKYRIAEIDDAGDVIRQRSLAIEGFTAVHGGMALTRDYYILFSPSLSLDLNKFFSGTVSVADCVGQRPGEPTAIHLIPRHPASSRVVTVQTTGCFVTHSVNAYQSRTGHVVVDVMASESLASLRKLSVSMRRFVIDAASRSFESVCISPGPMEFPAIHPGHAGLPYRFAYASAAPWGWVKLDVDTGESRVAACGDGPHAEPTFVPRPGGKDEDDGWIMGYILASAGKRLCIVDAKSMQRCCEFDATGSNALGLHGCFVTKDVVELS